jgi:hypothetical protein
MVEKSLDRKLAALRANIDCGEFIIADAKDADMAYGIAAPGKSPEYYHDEARYRTWTSTGANSQVIRQGWSISC